MLGSVPTKGAHLGIEKYVNTGRVAGVGEKMAVNFFTEEEINLEEAETEVPVAEPEAVEAAAHQQTAVRWNTLPSLQIQ